MAKITPVYYLQSGTVKFWQQEGATSSATIITPNAIVTKKQSLVEISYNPYERQTIVAVYKGQAGITDLVSGKKMQLVPTNDGKPQVAIISLTSQSLASPSSESIAASVPTKPALGLNNGILIVVGLIAVVLGYIVIRKRSHLTALYNRFKQWSLTKIRKGKNNE